jgi:predicted DnaQ family exonuclease/DinG family helicase
MPKMRDVLSSQQKKNLSNTVSRGNSSGASSGKKRSKKKPDTSGCSEFVALDVETTGLDAKKDRIIELGAVKYRNGREVDCYSSFVDPGCPVPEYISKITGIYDDDLEEAPLFGEILDQVEEFIGTFPICGHKVDFDISFLNAERGRSGRGEVSNSSIDTLQLSRIVHPGLRSYRLYSVCKERGYIIESAHRALDDAKAAGFLCNTLLPELLQLPDAIKRQMASFAPLSYIKLLLKNSTGSDASGRYRIGTTAGGGNDAPSLECECGEKNVSESRIREAFDEGGEVARALAGFRYRKQQLDMAMEVTRTLNAHSLFAAEAETGIGKSMAYLYPACCFALHNSCRVFISTYTKQLQDQLMEKELAALSGVMENGLRYTVLKGRRNYLCKYRFKRLLSHKTGNLSPVDRNATLPLIRWAAQTESGDIQQLSNFAKRNAKIWDLVSGDTSECRGMHCTHYDECFVQKARRRALSSHIVVINHSLFFSDMCMDSSFLGTPGALIFDEAHHLEESGHQNLRVIVDSNGTGLLLEKIANCGAHIKTLKNESLFSESVQTFVSCTRRLRKKSQSFLHDVASWARRNDTSNTVYTREYPAGTFDTFESFAGLTIALSDTVDVLNELRQKLSDEEAVSSPERERSALRNEIVSCSRRVSQYKADILYLAAASNEGDVFWLEGNHAKGWVKLCGVALDIGSVLAPVWQRQKSATVFTSGTMSSIGGSMEYMLEKIGFKDPHIRETIATVQYRAPFSDAQRFNAAVALRHEPDAPEYPGVVGRSLEEMYHSLQKNMLVLFTSNEMLRAVYESLQKTETVDPARIFAQGITGNRSEVLHTFCTTNPSILLGTSSFWEGIDAPGRACELVIIPRLPFPVPGHPIIKALTQRYEKEKGNAFSSYYLPESVIRLKQAVGRLIRTVDDRGAFVVLDPRMLMRSYGKAMMNALPGEFTTYKTIGRCCEGLGRFFSESHAHIGEEDEEKKIRYVSFSDL